MRVVVFLFLLSSLLPRPVRAQLWRYPDPCAAVYERWNWDNWGKSPAIQDPKPTCYLRPTIPRYDVSPDSVQLVQRCQNHMRLPKSLNGLRFIAEGATAKLDLPQHELLLVPAAATVTLRAVRGRQVVWENRFQATEPPLPEVKCFLSDVRAIIFCKGTPPDTVAQPNSRFGLVLRTVPPIDFAEVMPLDARYRFGQGQLTVLRGGQVVAPAQPIEGDIDLAQLSVRLQDGDELVVDVYDVQRMNFRGEMERIPCSRHFRRVIRH